MKQHSILNLLQNIIFKLCSYNILISCDFLMNFPNFYMNTASQLKQKETETINQETKSVFQNVRQMSYKNCEFNGHAEILVQWALLFLIKPPQSSLCLIGIILQSQIMTNLIASKLKQIQQSFFKQIKTNLSELRYSRI